MSIKLIGFLSATIFCSICQSCSFLPWWKPPTVTEKTVYADRIVYGTPLRIFPDENWQTAYTVEFQAICTVKGERLPNKVFNLTEAGHVPGLCTSSDLDPKDGVARKMFVIFRDTRMTVSNTQIESGPENIDLVKQACDLDPLLPADAAEGSSLESVDCPVLVRTSKPGCLNLEDVRVTERLEREAYLKNNNVRPKRSVNRRKNVQSQRYHGNDDEDRRGLAMVSNDSVLSNASIVVALYSILATLWAL